MPAEATHSSINATTLEGALALAIIASPPITAGIAMWKVPIGPEDAEIAEDAGRGDAQFDKRHNARRRISTGDYREPADYCRNRDVEGPDRTRRRRDSRRCRPRRRTVR